MTGSAPDEDRVRLWPRLTLLAIAFLALTAAGVVTVLLPELADDPEEAETTDR